MGIILGPHDATLKYRDDDVDPFSLGGIQKEWKCLSEQLCQWPYCQCDPIAKAVLEQIYDHEITVPAAFKNHRIVKQHSEIFPVGTAIADRPPDRSGRAQLRHPAPTEGI